MDLLKRPQPLPTLFVLSALLMVVSCTQKGSLPGPEQVDEQLLEEPRQTKTHREPFSFEYAGKRIDVRPVAEYELYGLVVTHNNIDGIADNVHDTTSVDTRDLCVLWGQNLSQGDYQKVKFKSGPSFCYFSYRENQLFFDDALANNHMITESPELRKALEKVRIGDQIRFKGLLVDYTVEDWQGWWRRTSRTRKDGGNGACEVVLFEELEIIEAGTPLWYTLYRTGQAGLALVPVFFLIGVLREVRRTTPPEEPAVDAAPPANIYSPS